jgi:phosphate-selective porin
MGSLTREPRFSGYISVRETIRDDTMTFIVNRARVGVQALPASFVAVRLQADLSALSRVSSGDTVPAVLVTDAFVQLAPTDTASRMVQLFRPAVLIGQFRTPFSLEALTSFSAVVTVNRSLGAERLATRRDRGVGAYIRFPRYATLGAALVDGEGTNRLANPDGRQMAIGRLTLQPISQLTLSGKWAGQGSDHRWGYDARWLPGNAILEGEVIERDGPISSAMTTDARSAYALAAYRVRPWLQPVVKWEQLEETNSTATVTAYTRSTLTTVGVNLLAPDDRFRVQLNWIDRSDRPVDRKGELVAQFQALF